MGSDMVLQKRLTGNNNEDYLPHSTNDQEEENSFESYCNANSEENLPMDFCKHTSLHGLKYIGEKKQHLVERL